MAIDPSKSVPEDAASVSSLQSMTEESAKAAMRAPVDQAWGNARGSLVGNIIGGLASSLMGIAQGGIFSGLDRAAETIHDGQEALNNRADLLDPLLDYGSVCIPAGLNITGTGPLPYRQQIGPMRGVSIRYGNVAGAGLSLDDVGLWDIRLQVTASWVRVLTSKFEVALNVYPPGGGSPFSSQRAIFSSGSEQTVTIVSSVVIDEPGYYAIPFVSTNASTRQVLGGPGWSRLTAQHITRDVDGSWGDGSENSDEPEPESE